MRLVDGSVLEQRGRVASVGEGDRWVDEGRERRPDELERLGSASMMVLYIDRVL
mgnify:CR=1 FL=1